MAKARSRRAPGSGKRPRGRPRELDRGRIVEAAAALGLPNLTMRAVADALGVSDAALYYHFRNRAALVSAVVDTGVRRTEFPEDRGQPWREWLTGFAEALRALCLESPGAADFASVAGPTSPAQVELVARVVGVLTRSGFGAAEAARIYSLVTSFVLSSVRAQEERAVAIAEGADIASRFAEALSERGEEESRALREVARTWLETTPDARFRYGLETILRGIGDPPSRE